MNAPQLLIKVDESLEPQELHQITLSFEELEDFLHLLFFSWIETAEIWFDGPDETKPIKNELHLLEIERGIGLFSKELLLLVQGVDFAVLFEQFQRGGSRLVGQMFLGFPGPVFGVCLQSRAQ